MLVEPGIWMEKWDERAVWCGLNRTCEKNGVHVCIEVKTVTKQSSGVKEHFLEDQLYEKVRTFATKAAAQLKESANVLKCEIAILACVVNWFHHLAGVLDAGRDRGPEYHSCHLRHH